MMRTVTLALAAATIGLLTQPHHAHAEAPACDQLDVTQCYWSAEVDGQLVDLPGCAEEDGNVDGLPCLWRHDGRMYYVTSENYR